MPPSPLEEARELLLQTVDVASREVFASRLHLVQLQRSDAVAASASEIQRELGARGLLNSSIALRRIWDAALVRARNAADEIIEACFS
jgi:hypothetical protein